jgi:hypothetical protein
MVNGRKTRPTLDQSEGKAQPARPDFPDSLDYYADDERWRALGKQVQTDAAEERRTGVAPAGAHGRLATFRALRKRLDRRAR